MNLVGGEEQENVRERCYCLEKNALNALTAPYPYEASE